jgi:hypothetical protein
MNKINKIVWYVSLLTLLVVALPAIVKAEEVNATSSQSVAESAQIDKPAILPDSPFYFIKRIGEGLVNFLTFGKVNQAKRALELSQVRLAESQDLLEKNKTDLAQKANQEYQTMLGEASQFAQKAQEDGKNIDDILIQISKKTLNNQQVLLNILEKAPEPAKIGLQNAIKASAKERQHALQILPEPVRQEVEVQDFDANERVQNKIQDLNLEGFDISENLDVDNELEQIENEISKLEQTDKTCKETSDCGKPLICSDGSTYPAWSCDNEKCSQIKYFRDPCSVIPSSQPYIHEIAPRQGTVGSQINIEGSGFSATGNTIMFSFGAILNVNSKNGTVLTFTVPGSLNPLCFYAKTPCLMMSKKVIPGKYEVYVKNDNGTSNSVIFEVVDSGPRLSVVPPTECKEASDCGKPIICANGKEYPAWSCSDGKCFMIDFASDPCLAPLSIPGMINNMINKESK